MFRKIEDLVTKAKAFVFPLEKEQYQDIFCNREKTKTTCLRENLNDAKSYSV